MNIGPGVFLAWASATPGAQAGDLEADVRAGSRLVHPVEVRGPVDVQAVEEPLEGLGAASAERIIRDVRVLLADLFGVPIVRRSVLPEDR